MTTSALSVQIRVIDDDTQRDEVPDVPEGYDDDENLSDESSSDSEEEVRLCCRHSARG